MWHTSALNRTLPGFFPLILEPQLAYVSIPQFNFLTEVATWFRPPIPRAEERDLH